MGQTKPSPWGPRNPLSTDSSAHSLIHSLTHSFIHSLPHSFTHPLTCSPPHSFIPTLIHYLIHSSLIHSLPHSLTHLFTPSFPLSLIHSLTHSVTHSFTHSFINSLIPFTCSFIHSFSTSARLLSTRQSARCQGWHVQSPPCQKNAKEVMALGGHKPLGTLSSKPQGQVQAGGLHPPRPGGSRKGPPRLPQLARRRSYLERWMVLLSSFTQSPRDRAQTASAPRQGTSALAGSTILPSERPSSASKRILPWDP